MTPLVVGIVRSKDVFEFKRLEFKSIPIDIREVHEGDLDKSEVVKLDECKRRSHAINRLKKNVVLGRNSTYLVTVQLHANDVQSGTIRLISQGKLVPLGNEVTFPLFAGRGLESIKVMVGLITTRLEAISVVIGSRH